VPAWYQAKGRQSFEVVVKLGVIHFDNISPAKRIDAGGTYLAVARPAVVEASGGPTDAAGQEETLPIQP
jgi:hypothetical protein